MFAGKRASAALFALLLMVVSLQCLPISQPAIAVYNYGGEEQILVDPVRHVVYWTDLFGSDLLIYDSDTGELLDTIPIGYQLSSLSLSPDNSVLYISVLRDQQIVAIDPDSRSVTKRYSVDFIPFSIRASTADRLYVTGAETDAGTVKVMDLKSGNIRTSLSLSWDDLLLELSPDGSTLIVAEVNGNPSCEMWSYTTNGWLLTQRDKDNGELTGGTEQMEVDWASGLIYHAPALDSYVEVVSLSNLRLLNHFATTPSSLRPSGLCLSKDGKMAYVTTYASENFCAYNTTTLQLVASEWFSDYYEVGLLAASNDGRAVFSAQPFVRFSLDPTIKPGFPAPGSVLSFTPPWVDGTIRMLGMRGLPVLDIVVDLDGEMLEHSVNGSAITANITHSLPNGSHTVNVTFVLEDGNSSSNWTFTVDRADPSTHPPSAAPYYPGEYYYINESPVVIIASVTASYPEIPITNVSLFLDGVWLPGVLNYHASWSIQYISNVSFQLATGSHSVSVEISWGPESSNSTWNFTYQKDVFIFPSYPTPGSTLTASPQSISARIDAGSQWVTLDSVSMMLNGVQQAPIVVVGGHTPALMRMDLTTNLTDGYYNVWVEIEWEGRSANASWSFIVETPTEPPYDDVVGPITLVMHESPQGFKVPVPTTWDTQDDVYAGAEHVDVLVNGPTLGNIQTNYLVMTGTDDTIEETHDYLSEMANETVEELLTEDPGISFIRELELMTVDSHLAGVFSIRWSMVNLSQEIAIILSEVSHRYWLLVFTVSYYYYGNFSPLFDEIINGFDITLDDSTEPTDDTDDLWLGVAGLGFAALVGGLAGLIVWSTRRKRLPHQVQPTASPSTKLDSRPATVDTTCPRCGSRVSAGQTFCPNCGAVAGQPGYVSQNRYPPSQP